MSVLDIILIILGLIILVVFVRVAAYIIKRLRSVFKRKKRYRKRIDKRIEKVRGEK
jgi:flagellar biogenesis protein FliO